MTSETSPNPCAPGRPGPVGACHVAAGAEYPAVAERNPGQDWRASLPAIALWRKVLAAVVAVITALGFYLLSAGTLVLNGTTSLPHNGYAMLSWPIVPWKGGYVAFDAPSVVGERFRGLTFIKRVVGMPGDKIVWRDGAVCVADDCRDLLPSLAEKGFAALPEGRVPDNMYVVFGDAPDSLDSRYAVFGLVRKDQITAVGLPAPLPHWTEVQAWLK